MPLLEIQNNSKYLCQFKMHKTLLIKKKTQNWKKNATFTKKGTSDCQALISEISLKLNRHNHIFFYHSQKLNSFKNQKITVNDAFSKKIKNKPELDAKQIKDEWPFLKYSINT